MDTMLEVLGHKAPAMCTALIAGMGLTLLGLANPTAPAPTARAAEAGAPSTSTVLASSEGDPQDAAIVRSATWGDREADSESLDLERKYEPRKDPGSLFTITRAIGARHVWHEEDASGRAVTGSGVTVAVIDSGVEAVPGLDAPGKLVQGPDLSLEANSETPLSTDTYGHGTHLASIIAARDDVKVDHSGEPRAGDGRAQLGVAPDAQVLALKLATTDGSTDVSQVIAALDWVAQHRTDNGMNVRVVNLSFGTGSLQSYDVDPLAAAAEHAWHAGLVVVVSGGNGGPDSGGLTNPAIDPYVIAVGASEGNGKASGWDKPSLAAFSSAGNDERRVDLVAPGRSVAGLRNPDSFVDLNNPEGRVLGDRSMRLMRGSGTSQAAAVVSGAAALLLQAFPELTPDQVKAALVSTTREVRDPRALDAGSGQLDVEEAYDWVRHALRAKDGTPRLASTVQRFPLARGTGSLQAARGDVLLVDAETGESLSGEVDVQGMPWNGAAWAAESAAGTSWSGGVWNRARWSGDAWTATGWARARWSGSSWSRARWSDLEWTARGWGRARWSRARWSDVGWAATRWASADRAATAPRGSTPTGPAADDTMRAARPAAVT